MGCCTRLIRSLGFGSMSCSGIVRYGNLLSILSGGRPILCRSVMRCGRQLAAGQRRVNLAISKVKFKVVDVIRRNLARHENRIGPEHSSTTSETVDGDGQKLIRGRSAETGE